MNKILWLQHEEGRLVIAFASMTDANDFIREQSDNASWRSLWTFRYHEQRDEVMLETTRTRVVLHNL